MMQVTRRLSIPIAMSVALALGACSDSKPAGTVADVLPADAECIATTGDWFPALNAVFRSPAMAKLNELVELSTGREQLDADWADHRGSSTRPRTTSRPRLRSLGPSG